MLFLELKRLTALEHHALLKIQCLKKWSQTIFGCLLGTMATTPKVLARSRIFMKLNWLPAQSASTNKSIAAVSPNSLSVRSRASQVGSRMMLTLAHIANRSCGAARSAAVLPQVTRMALVSAWLEE